jgi:hypothetical protein
MKVSYKLVTGGGYIPLADETTGAAIPSEFNPSFSLQAQEDQLWSSESEFRQPKGNIKCVYPLTFNQQYASRGAAIGAVRLMAALLNQKLHLQVQEGTEVQYYPNAMILDYRPKASGCSIDHVLVFNSDNVTDIAP